MSKKPADHHAHSPRVEDDALVRGRGRFVDDVDKQGMGYAAFVRSPHAHARIVSVDIEAARKAPGVLTVLTAKDMTGVGNVSRHPPIPGRNGSKMLISNRPALWPANASSMSANRW